MAETDSDSDDDVLDVDLEEPEEEPEDEEVVESGKESTDSPESDAQADEAEDTNDLKDSIFRLSIAVGPTAFFAGILALVVTDMNTLGAVFVFIGIASFVIGTLSFAMSKFEETVMP